MSASTWEKKGPTAHDERGRAFLKSVGVRGFNCGDKTNVSGRELRWERTVWS